MREERITRLCAYNVKKMLRVTRTMQGAATEANRSKPQPALFQADKAVVADDDVVEQLDFQPPPRLAQLLGRLYIFRRGRRVARRMVVQHDDRRAGARDRRLKHLRRAHHTRIDRSL